MFPGLIFYWLCYSFYDRVEVCDNIDCHERTNPSVDTYCHINKINFSFTSFGSLSVVYLDLHSKYTDVEHDYILDQIKLNKIRIS